MMQQSVALNPNLAAGWSFYGTGLAFSGVLDDAIDAIERAIALSPRDPTEGVWIGQQSIAAFVVGRYEEGVAYGQRAVQKAPGFMGTHRVLAANLSEVGRMAEAKREVAEMLQIFPAITVARTRKTMPFRAEEALDRFCMALARAGLPEE